MRYQVLGTALMVLVAATACGPLPVADKRVTTTAKATATPKVASATPAGLVGNSQAVAPIVGDVRGPAGLLGDAGAALIGNNGGNVISEHGGALIGKTKYHPLAIADVPYPGVEVFVAGATGQAIPTFQRVTTDANGKFSIAGVPPGGLYLLVARFTATDGSQKVLQTLVKTTSAGATAHLTAASSFVAAALVRGQSDLPGDLDPAVFDRAVGTTADKLTDADAKLLGDNDAMGKRMDELAAAIAELKSDIGSLKAQLTKIQQGIDDLNQKIDKILASPSPSPSPTPSFNATVALLVGGPEAGNADGDGQAARFGEIGALAADAQGRLFISDAPNHRLCEVFVNPLAPEGTVRTVDVPVVKPGAIAVSKEGDVFVADVESDSSPALVIRKIPMGADPLVYPAPAAAKPVAQAGVIKPGGADAAMLSTISALAVDATGTLYAVDATYHRAFKIAADGSVTRLAGAGGTATPFGEQPAGTPGFQDGADKEALFNEPAGLIVDTSGNLLIADRKNHAIRRMTPTGIVTTVAGGPARDKPTGDFVDGPVATARFNAPQGLALDGSGNLFIADTVNHRLRMLTPDGRVQTLAGTGAPGDANGPGTVAAFELPRFVATGPMGKVFVAEKARVRLVKLAP